MILTSWLTWWSPTAAYARSGDGHGRNQESDPNLCGSKLLHLLCPSPSSTVTSTESLELAGKLRVFPSSEKEVRGSSLPCLPHLSSLQLELVIPDLKTIVPMATPWWLLLATMAIFHSVNKVGSKIKLLFERVCRGKTKMTS